MTRIFPSYAYGDGPRCDCWWDHTCPDFNVSALEGDHETDVAVIGGGFTGLNVALTLREAGMDVSVLEAKTFGWGASGRNGGFCCLGGSAADDTLLDKRFGRHERLAFRRAEKDAIAHVEANISRFSLDVDRHSEGETELAHRPKDMQLLRDHAPRITENYAVVPQIIEANALADHGMSGPFHGAITTPLGFALNPRKYVLGLARASAQRGATLFQDTVASKIIRDGGHWRLITDQGCVRAKQVVIATNGYSSETLPNWLAGRYMPTQSNVIVTRPLSPEERAAQGWTSDQMAFDTRNLLHYFRLLPDGRFLFGMRGGLRASVRAEAHAKAAILRDFRRMFPAWAEVDVTHSWSGMVSMARNRLPFVGQIPGMQNVWTALCYHGNGVAMGSYAGKLLADMMSDPQSVSLPRAMAMPLARFPLGAARRLLMPPVYGALMLKDL